MNIPTGSKKRRGLGRGLDALLTPSSQDAHSLEFQEEGEMAAGLRAVSASAIYPNPHQPRSHLDEFALQELAASIRAHGVLQPLIVTAMPDRPGHFLIITGERRWRAAQLAGLAELPVLVREASPQQLLEWALVENLQREDLGPLEEAAAFHALIDEFHLTQAEVAERVGQSRSAVANSLRLLHLPASVQDALNSGRISAGHARALLALADGKQVDLALNTLLERDLNVRQTEALVRRMLQPDPPAPKVDEPSQQVRSHFSSLEEHFSSALNTKVSLDRRRNGSGRLVIHFYSDEELDSIYRRIVGDDREL